MLAPVSERTRSLYLATAQDVWLSSRVTLLSSFRYVIPKILAFFWHREHAFYSPPDFPRQGFRLIFNEVLTRFRTVRALKWSVFLKGSRC